MFSRLRPTLCYKNISSEIASHDEDIDADEWDYNGRLVFRGSADPVYVKDGLSVYWLYDSDSNRVGLSEHEKDNEEVFESLWFRDNDFSTLLQENWVSLDKTVWTLLSAEAYQDCLEDDFTTIVDRLLPSSVRLVFPSMIENMPIIYECLRCKSQSISESNKCSTVKKTYLISNRILFVDSNFIIYVPPTDSSVWSTLKIQPPSYDAIPASPPQELPLEQPPQQEQTPQPEHPLPVPAPEDQEIHP
jgi:hypothetical protein